MSVAFIPPRPPSDAERARYIRLNKFRPHLSPQPVRAKAAGPVAGAPSPVSARPILIPSAALKPGYLPHSSLWLHHRRFEFPKSATFYIDAVAAEHGLTADDILGPRRSPAIVKARHDAFVAVANAKPHLSLVSLGKIFRKDHTSILSALRKRGVRK